MNRRRFLIGVGLVAGLATIPAAPARAQRVGPNVGLAQLSAADWIQRRLYSQVTVAADGSGTQVLEHAFTVTGFEPAYGTTWYYTWPGGLYSNIRASDSQGPLNVSTERDGETLSVYVHFRRTLRAGDNYSYTIYITVGNVALRQPDQSWDAYWYIHMSAAVEDFRHTMVLPVNAQVDRADPPPTSQQNNQLTWRRLTSEDTGIDIHIYYRTQTTNNVSLYLQTAEPWRNDPYAWYTEGQTDGIWRWGCAMCCAAMVVSYYGSSGNGFQTNPRTLNNHLRGPVSGYDASNGVKWDVVARYADNNGIPLRYYSGASNDAALRAALETGDLIVVAVNNGGYGHFVLVTGTTTVNNQATFTINDPIYGVTTLLQQYGGSNYSSARYWSVRPLQSSHLAISAHSPVQLIVTDPQGQRTGYDPHTDTVYEEIPNAFYREVLLGPSDGPANGGEQFRYMEFVMDSPENGDYSVAVLGTGDGAYTIQTVAANWEGAVSQRSQTGIAAADSQDELTVTYDDVDGVVSPLYIPVVRSSGSDQ